MARNPKHLGGLSTVLVTILILALIAATGFVIYLCLDLVNQEPATLPTNESVALPTEVTEITEAPTETTVPPTTAPPEPEKVVATATVASQGDLLMHSPVFNSAIGHTAPTTSLPATTWCAG